MAVDTRGFDFGPSITELLSTQKANRSNLATAALNRDIGQQGLDARNAASERDAQFKRDIAQGLGQAPQDQSGLKQAVTDARPEVSQEQAILRAITADPDQAAKIIKTIGLNTDSKKKEFANFAFDALAVPFEQRGDLIRARAEKVRARGGDPSHSLMLLDLDEDTQTKALEMGKISALTVQERLALEKGPELSAGQRERADVQKSFTQEEKNLADRVAAGIEARAVGSAVDFRTQKGTALEVAETEKISSRAKEEGKLEAKLNLEPSVAAAVIEAKNTATAAVKSVGVNRSNKVALDTYTLAMSNLAESLGDTATGPIAGWLPAMTDNQQIAKGAVAIMAPVLKSLFRTAGEGTFTDKDQELLMDMVPTRKDSPAAIKAKITAINSIVTSKLGSQEQPQATTQQAPPQAGSQQVGRFLIEVEQ